MHLMLSAEQRKSQNLVDFGDMFITSHDMNDGSVNQNPKIITREFIAYTGFIRWNGLQIIVDSHRLYQHEREHPLQGVVYCTFDYIIVRIVRYILIIYSLPLIDTHQHIIACCELLNDSTLDRSFLELHLIEIRRESQDKLWHGLGFSLSSISSKLRNLQSILVAA